MSKDTKILIPEIPGEWTERTRSGHTCKWNDGWHGKPHRNGLPYVELMAPEKGLYAERIEGPGTGYRVAKNAPAAPKATAT